jgi:hypothetical protein
MMPPFNTPSTAPGTKLGQLPKQTDDFRQGYLNPCPHMRQSIRFNEDITHCLFLDLVRL